MEQGAAVRRFPCMEVTLHVTWMVPGRARVTLLRAGAEGAEVVSLGEVISTGLAWAIDGRGGIYEVFGAALGALLRVHEAEIVRGLM